MERRISLSDNWTTDQENLLDKIRKNCSTLADYHRNRYLKFKSIIKYFRLPVICISGINSVFSVGLNSFVSQSAVSVINCLLSLICGIIVSIELFLQIQNQMDLSNSNSKDFYILSVEIFKTLSLQREHRNTNASSFLDEKYGEYLKIISSSSLLTQKIKDNLEEIPISLQNQVYSNDEIIEIPEEIPTRPAN